MIGYNDQITVEEVEKILSGEVGISEQLAEDIEMILSKGKKLISREELKIILQIRNLPAEMRNELLNLLDIFSDADRYRTKILEEWAIAKDNEIEKECQRNNILLTVADEEFRESPFYKQLVRDLEIMTEAKKTAERQLELSVQREEKLRDRLKELEKITSVPKHNARNAGRKKADERYSLLSRGRNYISLKNQLMR